MAHVRDAMKKGRSARTMGTSSMSILVLSTTYLTQQPRVSPLELVKRQ